MHRCVGGLGSIWPFAGPVSKQALDIVGEVEDKSVLDAAIVAISKRLRGLGEREVLSRRVGDWVMSELRRIDQVAYVRFASVYRKFEDVQAFREEVEQLERDLPSLSEHQLSLLDDPVPAGRKP